MITLHELTRAPRPNRKRIGRGHGSGTGAYSGKGIKGQRARTGGRRGIVRRSLKALIERLPKVRGGRLQRPPKPVPVSLKQLEKTFEAGTRVTRDLLVRAHLISHQQFEVVVLGGQALSKSLTVEAQRFSKSAQDAITKAGGTVIRLPRPERGYRPPRRIAKV